MANTIKITNQGRQAVKALTLPLCVEAAQEIAQACNEQSSWGGYTGFEGNSVGVVMGATYEANLDNARVQRILKNATKGTI